MSPDSPLSQDDLDQVASAVVDGDLDILDGLNDDDRRAVDRRVREWRAALDALSTPVSLPSSSIQRDQIAKAIATSVDALGLDGTSAAPASVTTARTARSRSETISRWSKSALAVAAALLVVALAVAGVRSMATSSSRSSTAKSASAGTSASSTSTAFGPAGAANGSKSQSRGSSPGVADLGDIGHASTAAALATLVTDARSRAVGPAPVAGALENGGAVSTTTAPATIPSSTRHFDVRSAATCDAALRAAHPRLGALSSVASGTLGSVPVDVLVYRDASVGGSGERLIALESGTCQVLVDRPL